MLTRWVTGLKFKTGLDPYSQLAKNNISLANINSLLSTPSSLPSLHSNIYNILLTNYFLNTFEYFSLINPKHNLLCYFNHDNSQLYFQYNESLNKSYLLTTTNTSNQGLIQLQASQLTLPSNLNSINISNLKIY